MKKLNSSEKQEICRLYKRLFCYEGSVFYNINGVVRDGRFAKDIFISKRSVDSKIILRHLSEEGDPDQDKRILLGITPLMKGRVGEDSVFFCKWGAIDIDGPKNPSPKQMREITEKALLIYRVAKNTFNLNCYLEKSRSRGYHLFFFLDQPVKPEMVKQMLEHICMSSGFPDEEVFPKQTSFRDKDNDSQFSNAISLPICGSLYLNEKSVFGDVNNNSFSIRKNQLEFIRDIKQIGKIEWIDAVGKLPNITERRNKIVRMGKKDFALVAGDGNAEKGKQRCEILRKLSSPDYVDDCSYNDWLTANFSMSLFENSDSLVDILIVNSSRYPKNVADAKLKIEWMKSSGSRGNSCSYTTCSKKGDLSLCRFQQMSKCLVEFEEEKIEDCPYEPSIQREVGQLKNRLEYLLSFDQILSDKWNKGVFGEDKLDPIKMTAKDKTYYSIHVCKYLFYAGFSEELVFKSIPYFEYGWGDDGSKDLFWRIVLKAKKEYYAAMDMRMKRIAKDIREPFGDEVFRYGDRLGIYQRMVVESKEEGEKAQVTFKEMTNFFIEKKATVINDKNNKKTLFDVYPRVFRGERKFEVMVSNESKTSHTSFANAISNQLKEADISIYLTREAVPRIMYIAEKYSLSISAFSVDTSGYCEEAEAYFFRDKFFHNGRVEYMRKDNKMVRVGEKNFFLNYLNESYLEIRKTVPNPNCDTKEGSFERSEIVRKWKKSAPIMWGGPKDGLNAKMLMGWFCGLAYKKDIMERFFSYPLCFVAGNKGSGKNHNLEYFGSMLGFEVKWEALGFSNTSMAGLIRMMNQNDVLWVDEFKNSGEGERFQEMTKSAWTGDKVVKAKLGNQDEVQTYRCTSALLMTSQAKPDVDAFHERCVMLNIDNLWRKVNKKASDKAKEDMDLIRHQLSELYSGWILGRTDERKEWLMDQIKIKRDALSDKGFNKRISLNYAVIFACYSLIFHDFNEETLKTKEFEEEMLEFKSYMEERIKMESEELDTNPIIEAMDSALKYFNSAMNRHENKYKDFPAYVELSDGKEPDLMYINIDKIIEWNTKIKKVIDRKDHIGPEMIKTQFKKSIGFVGKKEFKTQNNELRQGGYSMVYKEGSEVFEKLKSIAHCEDFENGITRYVDVIKKRKK